jgi:acyl-[acyl-carrier-protein]-phospholipid O-acyltransferase/long-chain-fatty-acid--[acyl-carrier-protein] ligase
VAAVADSKKGERLILITERLDASLPALSVFAKAEGAPEIAMPKRVIHVHHLPLLGSGKVDYAALQQIADPDAA